MILKQLQVYAATSKMSEKVFEIENDHWVTMNSNPKSKINFWTKNGTLEQGVGSNLEINLPKNPGLIFSSSSWFFLKIFIPLFNGLFLAVFPIEWSLIFDLGLLYTARSVLFIPLQTGFRFVLCRQSLNPRVVPSLSSWFSKWKKF